MTCLLISTLAEYQTDFWIKVGAELLRQNVPCEFISFDDRSTENLRASGFTVYDLRDLPQHMQKLSDIDATKLFDKYGITTPESWFMHERFSFGEQNPKILQDKLCNALQLGELSIQKCKEKHGKVSLVQEVGGFLSVVGCFFAARLENITNWFIEPAFFKGRLFFTQDTFAAPTIPENTSNANLTDVQKYLETARQKKTIVIPEKDKLHYSSAIKKILNQHNLVRLLQKSMDKYLLGKRQEFGYIGRQLSSHIKMLINSRLLKNSYTPLTDLGRFVYFPLHVPADMALTIRSPEYVDQLSLLEHIIRATPQTHKVAVKEHPAMIGALDALRFRTLLRRYPQFKILNPATSNYDVINASELVVSINSKSGAEALLLGKQIAVLGAAFYTNHPLVQKISSVRELPQIIANLLAKPASIDSVQVEKYFHAVWNASLEGELYVHNDTQITTFTDSMLKAVTT